MGRHCLSRSVSGRRSWFAIKALVSAFVVALAVVAAVTLPSLYSSSSTFATDQANAAESPVPCSPPVRACVLLGAKKAWLLDTRGRPTFGPVPILPGSVKHPTPKGRFRVTRKDIDHVSALYPGSKMPYSVFFGNTGTAFHEGSLVRPSAGCIHLDRATARRFYDALRIGDAVQILP